MQDRPGRDDVRVGGDPNRVGRREGSREHRERGGGVHSKGRKVPEPVRRLFQELQEAERSRATCEDSYRREAVLLRAVQADVHGEVDAG